MEQSVQRRWRNFWLVFCLLAAGLLGVQAALVDLDAYVQYAIYDDSGVTNLPNGAIVVIMGSSNAVADPMVLVGTNYVAPSATPDDIVLGVTTIGANTSSNGTFFTTVQYDSDDVKYVYIRFFNTTNSPINGMVYWGESSNFFLGPPTLGVSSVNFNPGANLVTSNYNNFIVIPEPNTANLLVLVAGMAWAMRASMKKKARKKDGSPPEGEEK